MPLPEGIASELERMRMRLLEMIAQEDPQPEGNEQGSVDKQVYREALWTAAHALDKQLRDEYVPVDLDLHRNDEPTLQILHDFALWDFFTPHTLDDTGDITVPRYTPEESGLRVFFEHGRWFVTWLKLEIDAGEPESTRRELLVFENDKNGYLIVSEV